MVKVYLSLGSNLGDRESNLAQATMALSVEINIFNIVSSAYYESEPLYNLSQPDFLNSVLRCDTSLRAFDFFDVTNKIEKMLGRVKNKKRNQPRIIDIDILFFGDSVLETSELTIPHPSFQFRKFVLIPFAEIEPNFKVPNQGISINKLITNCPDQTNVRTHFMKSQA